MKCISKGDLVSMLSGLPDDAWVLLNVKDSSSKEGVETDAGFVVYEEYSMNQRFITIKSVFSDPIDDVNRNPKAVVLAMEKPENLPEDIAATQCGSGTFGAEKEAALATMLSLLRACKTGCADAERSLALLPAIGSRWKRSEPHDPSKGPVNEYTVIHVTNTSNFNPHHPAQVVYKGDNGRIWSRPLASWPGRKLIPSNTPAPKYTTDKGTLTEAGRAHFEELCNPIIDFMCGNFHPHVNVAITSTDAVISESIGGYYTEQFLRN